MMDLSKLFIRIRAEPTEEGVHVHVNGREHNTDGYRCWCGELRITRLCESCDGEGCWMCDEGFIATTADEMESGLYDVPCVIVHR